MMNKFFRKPFLSDEGTRELLSRLQKIAPEIEQLRTETVFYLETAGKLSQKNEMVMQRILEITHEPQNLRQKPFLRRGKRSNIIEIGPNFNFETAGGRNAVSFLLKCGISNAKRLEEANRFWIKSQKPLSRKARRRIVEYLGDPMTKCEYKNSPETFETGKKPKPLKQVPVLEKGIEALREVNVKYGAGLDDFDLNYVYHLITNVLGRNMTDAEFRDFGNSNSEHSRHHKFRAKIIINGKLMPFTLFDLIKGTLKNRNNSVIAFHDNASAIKGYPLRVLIPSKPGFPSSIRMAKILYHFVLTCETHNHPCLWEAYAGAGTGGGGRRRDNEMVGRGGRPLAAGAGFIGGNLNNPAFLLPWEDQGFRYDPRVESPLEFFIKATNGCFNDANEFGEPLVNIFLESFGQRMGKQRWESVKPLMFSSGMGIIDHLHTSKMPPTKGYYVVKLGGWAYRIGVGGGSASSMTHGQNKANLDYNSVQRADGEMANKVDHVIRTCIYLRRRNPIEVGHDQGAGGQGNNWKELVDPAGALFWLYKVPLGDKTLSDTEILIAEFQESNGVLVAPKNYARLKAIADREDCPCEIVGVVTGDGAFVVENAKGKKVVDIQLKHLLGDYPQKTLKDKRVKPYLKKMRIPKKLTNREALTLVNHHLGVGSKEWAVNKVDDSVGGAVVQAMKVGPLGLPISNYALIAPGQFSDRGEASTFGLRPGIGYFSPQAMANMVSAEALLKLAFVAVEDRKQIKASANWMLAAKVPGALAWLYDAAFALNRILEIIGIDIDGGKDSMSMASVVELLGGLKESIVSLYTLVITTYAACPNVNWRITPEIKMPGKSRLMFIDLGFGRTRLGGSVFAQCLKQIGTECPDVVHPRSNNRAFDLIQELVRGKKLLAGHFRGRGGLEIALTQMAYAGNCGLDVSLKNRKASCNEMLFNEELGMVLEYLPKHEKYLLEKFAAAGLKRITHIIGQTTVEKRIIIRHNGQLAINEAMRVLRQEWREISHQMSLLQATRSCVEAEKLNRYEEKNPPYRLTFNPDQIKTVRKNYVGKIKVAIIRAEGTNSEQEAWDACFRAGLDPVDVNINDIIEGRATLRDFRFIVFPGGFTFKDSLGAAVGIAAIFRENKILRKELADFLARPDTISLGICNGNQFFSKQKIMPWLMRKVNRPVIARNKSEKFENRFATVRIMPSRSILYKGIEGSILGIHSDHGEGRFFTRSKEVLARMLRDGLITVCYVDDCGTPTEKYPFNPSGSQMAIAGYCDITGRHNVIMPHPERTVMKRQWSYWPKEWKKIKTSPWLKIFHNAKEYLENN